MASIRKSRRAGEKPAPPPHLKLLQESEDVFGTFARISSLLLQVQTQHRQPPIVRNAHITQCLQKSFVPACMNGEVCQLFKREWNVPLTYRGQSMGKLFRSKTGAVLSDKESEIADRDVTILRDPVDFVFDDTIIREHIVRQLNRKYADKMQGKLQLGKMVAMLLFPSYPQPDLNPKWPVYPCTEHSMNLFVELPSASSGVGIDMQFEDARGRLYRTWTYCKPYVPRVYWTFTMGSGRMRFEIGWPSGSMRPFNWDNRKRSVVVLHYEIVRKPSPLSAPSKQLLTDSESHLVEEDLRKEQPDSCQDKSTATSNHKSEQDQKVAEAKDDETDSSDSRGASSYDTLKKHFVCTDCESVDSLETWDVQSDNSEDFGFDEHEWNDGHKGHFRFKDQTSRTIKSLQVPEDLVNATTENLHSSCFNDTYIDRVELLDAVDQVMRSITIRAAGKRNHSGKVLNMSKQIGILLRGRYTLNAMSIRYLQGFDRVLYETLNGKYVCEVAPCIIRRREIKRKNSEENFEESVHRFHRKTLQLLETPAHVFATARNVTGTMLSQRYTKDDYMYMFYLATMLIVRQPSSRALPR